MPPRRSPAAAGPVRRWCAGWARFFLDRATLVQVGRRSWMRIRPLLKEAGAGHWVWVITSTRPSARLERFTELLQRFRQNSCQRFIQEPSQPLPLPPTDFPVYSAPLRLSKHTETEKSLLSSSEKQQRQLFCG